MQDVEKKVKHIHEKSQFADISFNLTNTVEAP